MMASKLPCVIPTCTRSGLVHGLSWIGLAAPTTPWLHATVRTLMLCKVSYLLTMLDTRWWGMAWLSVKLRDGDRYAFCNKIYVSVT
ncbi:hypothetical protein TIFTF001_037145 [Ficus carica]|uniref:Uncharacterized protein n=1 Tax=Ficus carica TaxID=3494 RepID=A0AA88JBK3_FICCA|nr:hypothetical protein TIFTF001_037145 [Ficus carica]